MVSKYGWAADVSDAVTWPYFAGFGCYGKTAVPAGQRSERGWKELAVLLG